jgi:hypothetical protein
MFLRGSGQGGKTENGERRTENGTRRKGNLRNGERGYDARRWGGAILHNANYKTV